MPKFNYIPEEFEEEFLYEPNRRRRQRKYRQEREQIRPIQSPSDEEINADVEEELG